MDISKLNIITATNAGGVTDQIPEDAIVIDIKGRPGNGKTTLAHQLISVIQASFPDKALTLFNADGDFIRHDVIDSHEATKRLANTSSIVIIDNGQRHQVESQPSARATPEGPTSNLINALFADPDYAWSWHCNLAMAFYDSWKVDEPNRPADLHERGNRAAARFLRTFADIDITKHDAWIGFEREWAKCREAKT